MLFRSELKLIDNIVEEPLGGAHRAYDEMAKLLKERIETDIKELLNLPVDKIVEERYNRLMHYGYC